PAVASELLGPGDGVAQNQAAIDRFAHRDHARDRTPASNPAIVRHTLRLVRERSRARPAGDRSRGGGADTATLASRAAVDLARGDRCRAAAGGGTRPAAAARAAALGRGRALRPAATV